MLEGQQTKTKSGQWKKESQRRGSYSTSFLSSGKQQARGRVICPDISSLVYGHNCEDSMCDTFSMCKPQYQPP